MKNRMLIYISIVLTAICTLWILPQNVSAASAPPLIEATISLSCTTITDAVQIQNTPVIILIDGGQKKLYKINATTNTVNMINIPYTPNSVDYNSNELYVGCGTQNIICVYDLNSLALKFVINTNNGFYDMVTGLDGFIYTISGSVESYSVTERKRISSYGSGYYGKLERNPVNNSIYYTSTSVSPSDIHKISYSNGQITKAKDSRYHGDYNMSSTNRITPDGKYIINSSGYIFTSSENDSDDIWFNFFLGKSYTDLCFDTQNNQFYSVSGKTISQYRLGTYEQINSINIENTAEKLFYNDSQLFSIGKNASSVYCISVINPASAPAPAPKYPVSSMLAESDGKLTIDYSTILDSDFIANRSELFLLDANYLYKINVNTKVQTKILTSYPGTKITIGNGVVYVGCGRNGVVYTYNVETLELTNTLITRALFLGFEYGNDGYLYCGGNGSWDSIYSSFSAETGERVQFIKSTYSASDYIKSPINSDNSFYYTDEWGDFVKRPYSNGILGVQKVLIDSSSQFMCFSPDGKYIYMKNGDVYTYDSAAVSATNHFDFNMTLTGIAFDLKYNKLFVSNSDNKILWYQNNTFTIVETYQASSTIKAMYYHNNMIVAVCAGEIMLIDPYGGLTAENLIKINANVSSVILDKGQSASILLTAEYNNGVTREMTMLASYTVLENTIATVNEFGVINGKNYGETSVVAEYQNKSITIPINITPLADVESSAGTISKTTDPFVLQNTLLWGTVTLPNISAIAHNAANIVTIANADSIPGIATVTVTAPDGKKTVYTVNIVSSDVLESEHNYKNRTDETFVYMSEKNVDVIELTFSNKTYVEQGFDYIYITDSNGKNIPGSPFTGAYLADKRVEVPGNKAVIRLVSDGYVTGYGFKVETIREFINRVWLTDEADKIVAHGEIDNDNYANMEVTLFVGLYDENSTLIDVRMQSGTVDSTGKITMYTEINANPSAQIVKTFLWKKNNLKPIASVGWQQRNISNN